MPKRGPILIIEDDLDDQDMLKEVFDELQIPNTLHFFENSLEALEYLQNFTGVPFLILSDINLPGFSGLQLKNEINGNERLRMKCIPFIFISTTADEQFIHSAYNVQIQGFFVKPPKFVDLKEMIAQIIGYWKLCRQPSLLPF